ncbi:6384_t:CDS:1, partial [Scutellospora calospora]
EEKANFCEENMITFEQKIVYRKLHSMYKKALNKALQNKLRSQELIDLLQDFVEDDDIDDNKSDKSDDDKSYSDEDQQSNNSIGKENINP